jgi:hypothetical protein
MNSMRLSMRVGVTAAVLAAAGIIATVSGGATAGADDRIRDADRSADIVAIQGTQSCYGRAQDVVYRNYADADKARREGLAAFGKCFTPDAHIAIGLFGQAPFETADSLQAWVEFVRQFGQDHGYLSARHLLGNIEVVFTGPTSAVVYSAGTTPHFVGTGAGSQTPGIDWIIGNYRGEVEKINGSWMITSYRINADEFAHTAADYPLGRSDGSGNIGFRDNLPGIAAQSGS